MKKLLSIILCFACLGCLEAQNYWKSIGMQGIFLGAGPDGSYYSYYSSAYGPSIIRSQDEGDTWQIVLGYETGFDCLFNWHCFSVTPEGRVFLFEDYPYRAFFTDDNGDTWQTTASAPLIYDCTAEHLYALNNDTIMGVTNNSYAFWTTDGGTSWDTIPLVFMTSEDGIAISDLLVNQNGDVYLGVRTIDGTGGGIYYSTISDMENWQIAAASGCSITDMAFDPEGNVVACGWTLDGNIGFQHEPGFYWFDGRNIAVSENGIVYTTSVTEDNKAVLAYSLDHGETFAEIGEGLPLDPPVPGGEDGSLYYGYDNYLYFEGHGFYWKSTVNADIIYNYSGYFPLVQEGDGRQDWNVVYFITGSAYPDVYHTDIQFVEGDSIIDGVAYRQAWVKGPNDNEPRIDGFVREEDKRVYYRRQLSYGLEEEVLLYDFNLTVGDTVTVNFGNTTLLVLEESEVEVDGVMRRQLGLGNPDNGVSPFSEVDEYWIEGVGSTHGFLNSGCEPWSWFGAFVHLLCYYENDNLIWDNEEFDECVMNSDEEPFAVGDLLYSIISTDPPHVSVVGHVDGENAQGELDIPSDVIYEGVRYTVTEIGEWAFKNCTGLTGFSISSTIDTIQNGAFYGCSGFTGTLDLSFFLPVLKENVFRECSGFTGLILPTFITEIPSGLFCGCSGMTGTLVLSESESLEIIGEGAFAGCSGFTRLVLPNGLREIREQAFSGCTGFTGTLHFPTTLTHIKYGAFANCTGFSGDLVIPNSVVELGNTQNTGYYVNPEPVSTFADCFDHLELSQSLDTIGPRCFWGCTRLTGDLVIPEGVKAIFAYAFSECSGFNSLTLNESLDYIGAYAFNACTGLTGTLSIPESVEVGSYAFADCIGIEELALPHDFTVVNYELSDIGYVFDGCSGLTELTIPEGWTTIVKSEFSRCGNLTHVNLPESLTKIETNAFKECTNLEAINLPEGVAEIGNGAFARCRNLAHIELPTGLRTLGGQAFARCTSLTGEIIIPDLVQRIELMTFDSCYMLHSVVFGDSINYIAEPAFENTELSSLVLKAMTPPQLQRMSSPNAWHFPADIPIIVPCGTLEAYQNDENWGSFTNITEDCGSGLIEFHGSEWYYEIVDVNGNITYQHLEYVADTTVNHKDVQIIIRTNTLYDKGEHQEVTREYLYLEDEVVYWWNKDLQEFTVLYDLGAQPGDSWVIKVGTETLTMHVDAVDQYYYEGQTFRMLQVSDEGDLFSGTIVCGVGHLSSFFPERLMTRGKDYRVHGLRCYWNYGNLLFTVDRDNCDAIYADLHNGIEEDGPSTGSGTLTVYPNPTDNVLFVETRFITSQPIGYRITNLMGQTLMSGQITAETQQIDVSNLPQGMYFITIGDTTRKFVVD